MTCGIRKTKCRNTDGKVSRILIRFLLLFIFSNYYFFRGSVMIKTDFEWNSCRKIWSGFKADERTSTNESHSVINSHISAMLTYFKFKAVHLATKTVLENKIAIKGRSNSLQSRVTERMLAFLQSLWRRNECRRISEWVTIPILQPIGFVAVLKHIMPQLKKDLWWFLVSTAVCALGGQQQQ